MNSDNKIMNDFSEESFDDINLKYLVNFFLRNRFRILLTTFAITLFTTLFTFTQKKVYQGSFKILTESKDNRVKGASFNEVLNILPFNPTQGLSDNITRENILKSPYILNSSYEKFSKDIKFKNYNYIDFNSWSNKNLQVNFVEKSNIVQVKFKYHDKEIILSTLENISKKFQEYSKEDKIKTLRKTKNFLEDQLVIHEKKSNESMNALNKFSIENGLGSVDGFIVLNQKNSERFSDDKNKNDKKESKISRRNESAKRFKSQFDLLERYESIYLDLSSKLNPNSKELIRLQENIKYLKDSLKRPSKILVKFGNLKRIAERDLNILEEVDSQLNLTKFEEARDEIPWLIIANPKIDSQVAPRRALTGFVTLIFSFLGISLFQYYSEKKSGKLFEIENIKRELNFNFIDQIYYKEYDINELILKNILGKNNENNSIAELGVIFIYDQLKEEKFIEISDFFKTNLNIINFNIKNYSDLSEYKNIIIFLEVENLTINQVKYLNEYLFLKEEKVIGWISLNKKNPKTKNF